MSSLDCEAFGSGDDYERTRGGVCVARDQPPVSGGGVSIASAPHNYYEYLEVVVFHTSLIPGFIRLF